MSRVQMEGRDDDGQKTVRQSAWPAANLGQPRVYARGVARGDRDHRHADRPAFAGRAERPRIGPRQPVPQQPQADRPGHAGAARREENLPARGMQVREGVPSPGLRGSCRSSSGQRFCALEPRSVVLPLVQQGGAGDDHPDLPLPVQDATEPALDSGWGWKHGHSAITGHGGRLCRVLWRHDSRRLENADQARAVRRPDRDRLAAAG